MRPSLCRLISGNAMARLSSARRCRLGMTIGASSARPQAENATAAPAAKPAPARRASAAPRTRAGTAGRGGKASGSLSGRAPSCRRMGGSQRSRPGLMPRPGLPIPLPLTGRGQGWGECWHEVFCGPTALDPLPAGGRGEERSDPHQVRTARATISISSILCHRDRCPRGGSSRFGGPKNRLSHRRERDRSRRRNRSTCHPASGLAGRVGCPEPARISCRVRRRSCRSPVHPLNGSSWHSANSAGSAVPKVAAAADTMATRTRAVRIRGVIASSL